MQRRHQQQRGDDRPELIDGQRQPLERVAGAGALERVEQHAPAHPRERAQDPDHAQIQSSATGARRAAADQVDEQLFERSAGRRRSGAPSIGPCATIRPLAMTPMWVDSRSTISRMCEVRKIVPPRATNACSRSLICREATASMPSNGSSRKSSRGAGRSAAASDSFLRMPCEKSTTSVLPASCSSISPSRSPARLRDVAASSPCTCGDEVERLRRGEPIEERQVLGHDPDPALDRDRIRERIHAEDPHRAARRPQQSGQALDRRALAGAVRPEKAVEAAGRHGEVDGVDGAEVGEGPGQPARLDGKFHGAILSTSSRRRGAIGEAGGLADDVRWIR